MPQGTRMHRRSLALISSDEELRVTLARIDRFQQQVARLRQVETNPTNYRLSAEGYLAEIDRMKLEVRGFLRGRATE